jgi:hypothetical protein
MRSLIDQIHVGRATVLIAAAIAAAAFLYLVWNQDSNLYSAFTKALVAAGLVMVVLGMAERFWRRQKVQSAKVGAGPEGATAELTFENQVLTAVEQVNQRMSDHVATINQRLYDLEKKVLKDNEPPSEAEE